MYVNVNGILLVVLIKMYATVYTVIFDNCFVLDVLNIFGNEDVSPLNEITISDMCRIMT